MFVRNKLYATCTSKDIIFIEIPSWLYTDSNQWYQIYILVRVCGKKKNMVGECIWWSGGVKLFVVRVNLTLPKNQSCFNYICPLITILYANRSNRISLILMLWNLCLSSFEDLFCWLKLYCKFSTYNVLHFFSRYNWTIRLPFSNMLPQIFIKQVGFWNLQWLCNKSVNMELLLTLVILFIMYTQ